MGFYLEIIGYMLIGCLKKHEANKVLNKLHNGPVGGHFGGDTTAHKRIM